MITRSPPFQCRKTCTTGFTEKNIHMRIRKQNFLTLPLSCLSGIQSVKKILRSCFVGSICRHVSLRKVLAYTACASPFVMLLPLTVQSFSGNYIIELGTSSQLFLNGHLINVLNNPFFEGH